MLMMCSKVKGMGKKYDLDEIMVVNFISTDGAIQCGMKCLPDDIFAEVEEKLYKKYNNFRDTNNMFTANAKDVLRFKTMMENGIKDGDVVMLMRIQ